MNAAASTRLRLGLFAGLYFAQGVPWGFVTVAIMLRLATLGMGPAQLGKLGSLALLPWIAKPFLGLIADRMSFCRFGRRRPYILAAEAGMALSLLAMSFTDPMGTPLAFSLLLFVHNLFAAAQDVGTDALAIDILPEHERGRANGFMSAGKWAGVVVGGQGLLTVARLLGWSAAYATAIALLLWPAALVLGVKEAPPAQQHRHLVRDLGHLFSGRAFLLAALLALALDASDAFLFPLIYPLFTQKLQLSEQQVATLTTVGSTITAVASVGAGMLADAWGRRRAIVVGCLAVAGFDVVFVLAHGLWSHYAFLLAFTAGSAVAVAVAYTAAIAFFMDLTRPELAATQFQVSMALVNARSAWANRLGGRLAERFSPRAMFGLAAVVEIVPLLLLLGLGSRSAGAPKVSGEKPESRAREQVAIDE